MEYCRVLLLLVFAVLCADVTGQKVGVRVKGNNKRTQKPGTSMTLTCEVDEGLGVILTHSIQWVHVSLANDDESEGIILTNQQTLTGDASPSDYSIDVSYNMTHCVFILEVKRVKPQNDGIFRCNVMSLEDRQTSKADVYVIVPNDVQMVGLEFDGKKPIFGKSNAPETLEEGRYGVTCHAQGFNPKAVLHLFVGDEEQETGKTMITRDAQESAAEEARRYVARAVAADLDLRAKHSGQRLRCVARADFDGAKVMEASVPLEIITLEPVVECDKNVSARPGELYVKIKCRVQHDRIQIDGYSWEIGDTGEVIRPGETSNNFHEVVVEEEGEHVTFVTLDLYQVEEVHFETLYYLDIYTPQGPFREKAALIRLEPHPNSSTKTSAAFLVFLFSVLLSFFNCC